MSITIKNNKMKKTILALVLIVTAIACDSAVEKTNSDSTAAPVVDTFVPPAGIDTLVTVDGDTLISPIQK